jgi:hypothetical protein
MVLCDFARIDVTLCHRPTMRNLDTVEEQMAYIAQYFQQTDYNTTTDYLVLKFNNEQLHCDLNIIDSLEEGADKFSFSVWNVPDDVMFAQDDIILFRYYWQDDSSRYTIYHGQILSISTDRSGADWKTTITGEIIHSNLMYNWSAYRRISLVKYYSDIASIVSSEIGLTLKTHIEEFFDNIPLTEPILTYNKTVGEVLTDVCAQLSTENVKCRWKIINNDLFIYKVNELDHAIFNEAYDIDTLVVKYDDLLEFTSVNDNQVQFKAFGLPAVKAGVVIELNSNGAPDYITWKTDFLIVDEVEHSITADDGYISTVYAHILGTVVESEDEDYNEDYDESEY